jgi:hypothetical protein
LENAVNRILKFIKAMDSPYGQALEREIAGMDADQQLDRVIQALDTMKPPETKTEGGATLLPEDRKLIEKAKDAMDRFWSHEGKPK